MSGDFSRWSHEPWRSFESVLLQQGRVLTDADWNEGAAILLRRFQAGTLDTLGRAAVPLETADAFRIALPASGQLTIGPGRAYVDGLLAENHGDPRDAWTPVLAEQAGKDPVDYGQQPFLPDPPPLPTAGTHVVYLKVWQREVTAVEEPRLIEPALGIDTTARRQTVWQVRWVAVPASVGCGTPLTSVAEFLAAEPAAAGRLTATTADVPGQPDPCIVSPSGGYAGTENQLYRVEIHDPGAPGAGATFTWSRDNATVASRITEIPASLDRVVVESLGHDDVLAFHDGDWIEITDDGLEFAGQPGELRRIRPGGGVDDATNTILLTTPLPAGLFAVDGFGRTLPERNTRVRRWDQRGSIVDAAGSEITDLDDPAATGSIPVPAAGDEVLLEDGIVVSFSLDPAGGTFRTGDFWLLPARTASASVEGLVDAPPRGIHAHYAPLALLSLPGGVTDCRTVFPPLTGLDSLFYVAGDGQEATPNPLAPAPIPLTVKPTVGVARGPIPVAGATVTFTIETGTGKLDGVAGPAVTTTSANGEASVDWAVDPTTPVQTLKAELADASGLVTPLPVRFSARLLTADAVAYAPGACPGLAGAATVQEAIDTLCRRPDHGNCCATVGTHGEFGDLETAIRELAERHKGHVCICLLPEAHRFGGDAIGGLETLTLHGRGARIELEKPLRLEKVSDVGLREVTITDVVEGIDALVELRSCGAVGFDGIRILGALTSDVAVLVRVDGYDRLRISECDLVTRRGEERRGPGIRNRLPLFAREVLGVAVRRPPAEEATRILTEFFARPADQLDEAATQLEEVIALNRDALHAREVATLERLAEFVRNRDVPAPAALSNLFDRFGRLSARLAQGAADLAVALEISDGDGDVWLRDNRVLGGVAIYGPVKPEFAIRFDETIGEILRRAAERPPGVASGVGEFHAVDNSLGWIGASELAERVPLFAQMAVTGNVFQALPSTIIADTIALSSNTFTREEGTTVALAFGNAVTVTGNIGRSRTRLVVSAPDRAYAANARLDVQP